MPLYVPGTATASQVLSGTNFSAGTAYNQPGTMPNRGAVTLTPSQSAQAIAAGYHNGSGTVPAVSFDAAKVLNDTTIAGKAGTMPNITSGSDIAQGIGQWPDGGVAVYPVPGYRKGGAGAGEIKVTVAQLQATIANLSAGNIRNGVPLLGLTGTLVEGKKFASGYTTMTNGTLTVSGLAFQPDSIDYYSAVNSNSKAVGLKGGALGGGMLDRFSSSIYGYAEYVLTPIGNGFTVNLPYAINDTFWWRAWS